MLFRRQLTASLAALLGSACALPSGTPFQPPVELEVEFRWDVPKPDYNPAIFAFARVEDWSNLEDVKVLASAGPVPYDKDPSFDLQGIRQGDNRVLLVSFRDGATNDSPLLYYGATARFSIRPLQRRKVTAVMKQAPARPIELSRPCTHDAQCSPTFCAGESRCTDGFCQVPQPPCAASIHACVQVTCLEWERTCNQIVHPEACQDADGGAAYCDPGLGCVAGRAEAPFLEGTPVLAPDLGTLGTVFRLEFTASEPLSAPPVVRVDVGGRRASWALDPQRSNAAERRWAFTYTADGSELPGLRQVTVDLVDLANNAAVGLSAGSITLDFKAPALVGEPVVNPVDVRSGITTTLRLVLDEALDGTPEVRLVPEGAEPSASAQAWTPAGSEGSAQVFTYVPSGDETPGAYAAWVRARDPAGNTSGYLRAASLRLDFTPPALSANVLPWVNPFPAPVGTTVTVEITLDEPVQPGAHLVARRAGQELAFESAADSTQVLRFLHGTRAEEEGTWDLVVNGIADAAGNTADGLPAGTLEVDGTPPELVSPTLSRTHVNAQDVLDVTFSVTETLLGDPGVHLAGAALARVGTDTAPYTFRLPGSALAVVGRYSVDVELVDPRGNRAVRTAGMVDVDTVPPGLQPPVFTPEHAHLGSTVYLTINALETLAVPPPELTWGPGGNPGFTYVTRVGLVDTFSLQVTQAAQSGTYTLTGITLEDLAGNRVAVPVTLALDIDAAVPEITGLQANAERFSAEEGFNQVTVAVAVSERPEAMSASMPGLSLDCGDFQAAYPAITCTGTVERSPHEGAGLLEVSVTDAAGNVGRRNLPLTLDFTAPQVLADSVGLQLLPGEDNVLPRVTRARTGTTVLLSFALSEGGATSPTVTTTDAAPLEFTRRSQSGTSFLYGHTLDSAATTGTYTVKVSARDDVGNHGDSILALAVDVDQDAPEPPRVGDDGGVVYERIPWGAQDSQGIPRWQVVARAGTAERGAELIVYSDDGNAAVELGRAEPADGGVTTVTLVPRDREQVFVVEADQAGNTSAPVRVRDVRWVASLGGKVPGNLFANPHLALGRMLVNGGTAGGAELEEAGTRLATRDGRSVSVSGAGRWEQMEPLTDMSAPSSDEALVLDGNLGDLVLVRGFVQYGSWHWDAGRWRALPGGPVSESEVGAAFAAFDARRGRTVLFTRGFTWEWDGTQWTKVAAADPEHDGNPEPVYTGAMAYHGGLGRVVMLGGLTSTGSAPQDMWSWDGASWRREGLLPSSPPRLPAIRLGAALAYDPERDRLVLYGGTAGILTSALADTWEWDGLTWVQAQPEDVEGDGDPPACRGCAMAADPLRGGVLLAGPGTGQVWNWDGTRWLHLAVADPEGDGNPHVVSQSFPTGNTWTMAADPWHGQVWMFGADAPNAAPATWSWNGDSWRREPAVAAGPDGVPEPLVRNLTALDPGTGQPTVFFGGLASPTLRRNEVWRWDGVRWNRRAPLTDPQPEIRNRAGVVAESTRGDILLFGGALPDANNTRLGDTWVWANDAWTARSPVHTPAPRDNTALTHAADTGTTWMFGGAFGGCSMQCTPLSCVLVCKVWDDLWSWDGQDWTEVPRAEPWPPARQQAALSYDAARHRLVLYGGMGVDYTPLDDVWEWDGTAWSSRTPADPEGDGNPPATNRPALFFHPQLNRVVLLPMCTEGTPNHPWTWDGNSWQRLDLATAVGTGNILERCSAGVVWDPQRERLVVTGGQVSGLASAQTWEWHLLAGETPGVQLDFSLGAAAIPADATLRGLRARAVAGATGWNPDGALLPGARLSLWKHVTGWEPGQPNGAPASGGEDARLDATGPYLPYVTNQWVHVLVTPAGANSRKDLAKVSVDAAELTVDYRLP